MTKQPNNGRRICLILSGVLEVMAFLGAFAANYFTRTRLGMLRHMVYQNAKWEKAWPVPAIRWTAMAVIAALLILAYIKYRRCASRRKYDPLVMLWTVIVSAGTIVYLLAYNAGKNRAYYLISLCFILAVIMQNIFHHCYFSGKPQSR